MNANTNEKMDEENEINKGEIIRDTIKKKYYMFPQFSDKNKEVEYNTLRTHNIKEYICIHLILSLLVILIECLAFSSNLSKKDVTAMEIFVVAFSLLNCLMHIVVLMKIYFSSSKNAYAKSLFVAYIIINQVFQFLSLYFFTKENEQTSSGVNSIAFYNNKFSLYLHFFVDSVFILCLPTLKFFLSMIFMLTYLSTNVLLIVLINFRNAKNTVDFYYMGILSVLLLMFLILRYLMEKRNRILLFVIKDILSNSYKKWYDFKPLYDEDAESITVDIAKDKYDKKEDNYKFLFSDKSIFFNDFTINACYKDYYSVSYFLKKLLISCGSNKNKNKDVKDMKEEEDRKDGKDSKEGKENTGKEKSFEDVKKHLNESDILTIAYEADVLNNIKNIDSDEIGRNWDYSFIDSEYGKSTLVVLEVGHHLISPYIENNEKKRKKLQLFLLLINSMYFPNPYHNANHGATVCHLSKCLAHITDFDKYLNNTYMICYLIASIAHDVGHPGKTNAFLSETNHILSIRYNDMSILENYHCSITFSVLQLIGYDFLINNEDTKLVDKNNYGNMRKFIIELIISTDMKLHFEYVDIFKKRKRSENFDISDRDAINLGTINIKLADIGHTCLKWRDHAKWTMLVSEEFFSQKKFEDLYKKNKNMGAYDFNHFWNEEYIDEAMIFNYENIYINYVNNLNNVNKYDFSYIKLNFIHHHDFVKSIPSSQVYFFEIIVMPLIQELQSMERAKKEITQIVLHNLNINLKTWRLIEKNINLFYNTDKMRVTDYYKNLEKQKLLRGISLLDIAEEDVISLTESFVTEENMEKMGEEKKKEINKDNSEKKKK
ncbi:cyclic nucleotide phosphodiesterase, putative [Plasmodium malariae]|uniref:Phosphodiesterase n=1 Tax=Plasmodium malariae TaxID=5858 RepID=A0A1D3SPN2_PLAMA|nr:cyclic nucleotide phosphodiesterase, putative [Plasmodium malariae]SCO93867.1 cyclic nucleotide phosphodiesterase, putative [Plasmodium malariae]